MLLAVDIGNSDIVFALHQNDQWIHHWRIPSTTGRSHEALLYRLISELLELNIKPTDINQSIISSVVPDLSQPVKLMISKAINKEAILLNASIYPQLNMKILNPAEIGTDLVANAVAAYTRFEDTCLVVDFGTALTFTTISKEGEILGVAIAPGLKTAIKSLFKHTAQLPEVPLEVPDSALGKNTIHAIQAGVVMGYTGMVKHMIDQIKSEVGNDCKVIATGGLSSILTPLQSTFTAIDQMLTLDGLKIIAQTVGKDE